MAVGFPLFVLVYEFGGGEFRDSLETSGEIGQILVSDHVCYFLQGVAPIDE